jgi:hypothetical protein
VNFRALFYEKNVIVLTIFMGRKITAGIAVSILCNEVLLYFYLDAYIQPWIAIRVNGVMSNV